MPGGAAPRTAAVHTLVPAVTSTSEVGCPLVTTCSGSASGTVSTVYCHVPEHNGPLAAVGVTFLRMLLTTAPTCWTDGCPLQLVAVVSLNPDGATLAVGRRVGTALDGATDGGSNSGEGVAA